MKQKTRNQSKKVSTKKYSWPIVTLLVLLGVVLVALGGWAGWQYWQDRQLKIDQDTIGSKFKNIHFDSDTYQDEFLQAHVTYVVSENEAINKDIRHIVDQRFLPCKEAGQRNHSNTTFECNASPEINFATDAYLEVTYNFREYTGGDHNDTKTREVGRLYDRKTGKRLGIADLFKSGSPFAQKLAELSRNELQSKFGVSYYNSGNFKDAMMVGTDPANLANFDDFLLKDDEKLTIIFEPAEVAPASEGVVAIELDSNALYDLFNQNTIDVFLPKLKEQKEAAKRLAEEAAEQRKRMAELVGENRENIDCTKMKCIAITYDDGPYAPNGNQLLDILKERDAVTTFFMVGNRIATYAPELKRVVDEKSEIGNHSWDHADLTKLSTAEVASEINNTNQAIYNASGVYPKLMRPPYGSMNAATMAQINMPLAYWSVDTLDWKDRNPDIVYQRAIAGAKPGAIILMHEIHDTTIQAAPRIIDELQSQGYVLVTVSELFGITKDNLSEFTNKKLFHN